MLVENPNRAPEEGAGPTRDDPLAACAKAARGALSPNTERALRSDLALFTAWCAERGVPALPASAETVAAFVERRPATARIDAELAGPGTAEDTWTRRSEARIGTIESQLRDMAQEARRLGAENERLRGRLAGDAADARSVIDKQKAMIDELGRELARSREAPETGPFGSGEAPRAQPGAASPAAPMGAAPMIERFELEPAGSLPRSGSGAAMATPFTGAAKPVAGWLPAGSHAQAVVLAGVDASAGVSSQGDPRPVLLRIAGPAWTAAPSSGALPPSTPDGRAPLVTAPGGAGPAPDDRAPVETGAADPAGDDLREAEVLGRIWIAPFVDANGIYREASHVRVVLEPAGWRLP